MAATVYYPFIRKAIDSRGLPSIDTPISKPKPTNLPLIDANTASKGSWVSALAISHGEYRLTPKGIAILGMGGGIKRARSAARKSFSDPAVGPAALLSSGCIEVKERIAWGKKPALLVAVVTRLVAENGNDPRRVTTESVEANHLEGMVAAAGSIYGALVEAGFAYSGSDIKKHFKAATFSDEKAYPWELTKVSNSFWDDRAMVRAALGWIMYKTGKSAVELDKDDFRIHGLAGMVAAKYKGSFVLALYKNGYIKKPKPSEAVDEVIRRRAPYLKERRFCKDSVDHILTVKQIKPVQITTAHFDELGLGPLLQRYDRNLNRILVAAGYAYSLDDAAKHAQNNRFMNDRIYPWEIDSHVGNDFWDPDSTKAVAFKWMLHKRSVDGVPKDPCEIVTADFRETGLSGLYAAGGNSVYLVEVCCGFAYSHREILIQVRNARFDGQKIYPWQLNKLANGFWKNTVNRGCALIWLSHSFPDGSKKVSDLVLLDFKLSGLASLYQFYRGNATKMSADASDARSVAARLSI
ncbi:hypothetical protein HY990_03205 [Candidatus Micrarchaeota archaeon]|nr:hypothetical protein [Candidatus Micrarchaeota archaeon]